VITDSSPIAWWPLVTGLFGGLGLFLLGVQRLTLSLRAMTGEHLRTALATLTTNRFTAAATGVGVTAVVQSSTITTVLTVGFVAAGLMATVPALAVVLGANVGTTITAQVVAFDIRSWALALVAAGAVTMVATTRELPVRRAEAALGLGLVLFSMQLMSDSVSPLRSSEGFIEFMGRLDSPLLGLLAGAAATVVLQSSSATTALAIVLTSQGLVSTPAAVAIAIGANVGTCVTAGIAALGKPTAAVRVAVGHIGFNVVGAAVWIGFVGQLTWLAERLPGGATDPARALANAHTVFNVANAVVALALLGPAARLVERLVPERDSSHRNGRRHTPVPLDLALVSNPALALAAARRELGQLSSLVIAMSQQIPSIVLTGSHDRIDRLLIADDDVDAHHQHLVTFLAQIGQQPMTETDTAELVAVLAAAHDLETIGDVIETNVVRAARHRLDRRVELDARAEARIRRLHAEVHRALLLACQGLLEADGAAAQRSVGAKTRVHELVDRITASPLTDQHPTNGSLDGYLLERDIAEQLRRIAHVARRIARAHLDDH
jgi:phosphate:Na+ symporter